MKRLHIHVSVNDFSASIRFYSALFATGPTITKPDYAKWILDDPKVNFAISRRGAESGLDHLGIQVDSATELEELNRSLNEAAVHVEEQKDGACCYANSDKYWTVDPQDIAWEAFYTLSSLPVFDADTTVPFKTVSACCAPGAKCQ